MRKSLAFAGAALAAVQGTATAADNATKVAHLVNLAALDSDFSVTLSASLNGNVNNLYASHGSHSSHASHASHSSGSGGSYRAPAPYTPVYAPSPAPSTYTPATAPSTRPYFNPNTAPLVPPRSTRATSDQLKMMIMRVQAALYSKGYDPGAIDGEMTAETRAALVKFQAAYGLKIDGKMSTPTLNALGVALGN